MLIMVEHGGEEAFKKDLWDFSGNGGEDPTTSISICQPGNSFRIVYGLTRLVGTYSSRYSRVFKKRKRLVEDLGGWAS
jgi:hypothetical protein